MNLGTPRTAEEITLIKRLLELSYQLLAKLMEQKEHKLTEFCLAIQHHEGWFEGSRSWRNNNPGNVRFIGQKLAIGKDKDNFAIFKTYEDGFSTLKRMVERAARGLSNVYSPEDTLYRFFSKYAPSSDNNDPMRYAEAVAERLKVSPTIKLRQLT
jgi:hypothetical protein